MALLGTVLHRLPLSPAMFYLPVGFALGPAVSGMVEVDLEDDAGLLTVATEIALLISLFTVGLKMRVPLGDRLWGLPLRLGIPAMMLSVGLITLIGVHLLQLPLGVAVLLGAILSPTDPILASDVQVQDVGDRDRIRFGLSGEGGMNDGTTYPFVMLGLGLLGVQEAADHAQWKGLWLATWGIFAGAAAGWATGRLVACVVVHLRRRHRTALGMEEFLTMGLIALSYGAAHLVHGIGFVAVFAAGVAVRQIESRETGQHVRPQDAIGSVEASEVEDVAVHPDKASAWMTERVLGFNQQLERIAEFIMVILLGVLVSVVGLSWEGVLVAALLFFIVRPLAVLGSLLGLRLPRTQTALLCWFGIRGIGSLYYLAFSLEHVFGEDVPLADVEGFVSTVVTVIALSVVVHGISASPLMDWYARRNRRRQTKKEDAC